MSAMKKLMAVLRIVPTPLDHTHAAVILDLFLILTEETVVVRQ